MRRYVVLDTETTGANVKSAHRILEIGCVLVENGQKGEVYQQYLNPERDIDFGAMRVHGITLGMVKDKPKFSEIADAFLDFIKDSILVIHNAPFDMSFLNYELGISGRKPLENQVIDTLMVARKKFPGQQVSLDAMCRRFGIDLSRREKHGAALDADLLSDVFLRIYDENATESQKINFIEDNLAKREGYLGENIICMVSEEETKNEEEFFKKIGIV